MRRLLCRRRRLANGSEPNGSDPVNATANMNFTESYSAKRRMLAEESTWGISTSSITAPNSPVALIVIAAIWEFCGLLIVVLIGFFPDLWERFRVILKMSFMLLSGLGCILIVLQINAVRIPLVRATDKGPATVQCPDNSQALIPETCATTFTMEQLEMMTCNSCTGASFRPALLLPWIICMWALYEG